jgi:chromosomal replication initiation ATPase DnaA
MIVRAIAEDVIAGGVHWDPKFDTGLHPFLSFPFADVQSAVMAEFGLSLDELKSDSRAWRFSHARAALVFWARRLCKTGTRIHRNGYVPISYPALGARLGRDHTSIMHLDRLAAQFWRGEKRWADHMDRLSLKFLGAKS